MGKWETKMYERIQEAVCLLNQEYLCRFLERQTIYD